VQITAASGATVINGGDTPVAAVGSAVNVLVTTPVPVVVMMPGTPPVPTPAVISSGAMFTGFIINGSSTVLVPRPG
jgi:hypothetical protein